MPITYAACQICFRGYADQPWKIWKTMLHGSKKGDTILKLSSWPAGENIQCSEEDFLIDRVDEMSIRCLTVSITTSIHNLE